MEKKFSPYELFKELTKRYDEAYAALKESLSEKQEQLFISYVKAMSDLKTFECEDSYRLGRAVGALQMTSEDEAANDGSGEETSERMEKLQHLFKQLCCNGEKENG